MHSKRQHLLGRGLETEVVFLLSTHVHSAQLLAQAILTNRDSEMDLHLRCIATHPRAGASGVPTAFAFSSRRARLVTAASDLLIDQSTSSNALSAVIRLSARVEELVYVGGSGAFLAFLENGIVASYAEHVNGLRLVQERRIGGAERPVALAAGAKFGHFALFAKVDSPSLWCLPVADGGAIGEPFKLRSDIEGDQENVNFVGGVFAKMRGKVATKARDRVCPVVAVATHPSLSFVAAAYTNGIVRVWDINKKEQRSHFDVQLAMREGVVDIAMHPTMPVVALCTNHGRLLTFYIKSALYRRGEESALATSKTRERKRRFRAMCFLPGNPSYLLLLAASRRIVVRRIDKAGMIVNSSRYTKASRPLSASQNAVISTSLSAATEDMLEGAADDGHHISLLCEPAFGLIATNLDNSGNIYVFQPREEGLPAIRRPLSCGLDTGFSQVPGNAFKGPVLLHAESLVAQRGVLFSYELGSETATKLCQLPAGDAHRIEVARDQGGYCVAALVFYSGDDEVSASYGYSESEPALRYVLCTKRGDGLSWNASEPGEGRSGCFLDAPGQHSRILILGVAGNMASILSFGGIGKPSGSVPVRQSRGVQRFKFDGKRAVKVFRTPFSSWTALLYHDAEGRRLCVSSNAFEHDQSRGRTLTEDYAMDDGTAFSLYGKESVIDVRWQRLPTNPDYEHYLGAILTDKRIYFVRDILEPLSVFEFQRIEKMVVPFAPPSFSWMGPSVMMLFGNSLHSVTLDGRSDVIAGLSHGENVTTLVATLPDRVVYARPSPTHALNSISIASRPYSSMSGLVRGMLNLPTTRSRDVSGQVEKVRLVLENQDVSQGSLELTKALIGHQLASVAYLLAVSEQGQFSMPPLKRAGFLGRMGDIRGALAIAESEYARLPNADSFHEGTELYRMLQRILNMSFASGDFEVGRRCSTLLGRKGTFSSFLDMEGGYAAVVSVSEYARSSGNRDIGELLQPLIEKSMRSSVATDSSMIPSRRELDNIRRTIQSVNLASIPLGDEDKCEMFMHSAPGLDADGNPVQQSQLQVASIVPTQVSERLEMFQKEIAVDLTASEDRNNDMSGAMEAVDLNAPDDHLKETVTAGVSHEGQVADSSDEEDLFNTAGGGPLPTAEPPTDISEETKEQAAETRRLMELQKAQTSAIVQQGSADIHALLQAQRSAVPTGRAVPATRAAEMRDRGIRKLDESRLDSAIRLFDSALRIIKQGRQSGQQCPPQLVLELVHYKLYAKLRYALQEIGISNHANTMAGRMTYVQLATAGTSIPLRSSHRVEALIAATDANIVVGNFGAAAQTMQTIKEVGVPSEEIRASLRNKYAVCSTKGFTNAMPQGLPRICYHSLKVITPGVPELRCAICGARFLTDVGLAVGATCSCCGLGPVTSG